MENKSLRKKNLIVTGGAGFIGSHLCERLVRSHNVICIDNFQGGMESNIDHLNRLTNFEFIRHDLTEPLDLESFPELKSFELPYQGVSAIFHLACPTIHKHIDQLTVETALANSHATKHALDLAIRYHAKFLFASTASIYGDPLEGQERFVEEYWGFIDPLAPRGYYNEGKRFAEMLVKTMGDRHKMDYKIARIFNTYGPRMKRNDGRKIPDMIAAADSGEPIKIYGDGSGSNSYCYIDDLVDGLLRLAKTDARFPINLGHPDMFTDQQLAEAVLRLMDSKSQILYRNELPSIARPARPDIHKAQKLLNWFPLMTLEQGLKKTIEDQLGTRRILNSSP